MCLGNADVNKLVADMFVYYTGEIRLFEGGKQLFGTLNPINHPEIKIMFIFVLNCTTIAE